MSTPENMSPAARARAEVEAMDSYADMTTGEQEAAVKALKDLYSGKAVTEWSAPGELAEQYGVGAFFPRVVRVFDGNTTVGTFRLTPVAPDGKWSTSYDTPVSGPWGATRRYAFPPDSPVWDDHRLDDGFRVMIEQLEPGKATAGTGPAVTVYDGRQRKKLERKKLQVTVPRPGVFKFRDHGFTVRAGKLARGLWLWGGDVAVSQLRAVLGYLG